MSHFSLMVKVTAERLASHNGDLEEAIECLMKPYAESGCERQYERFVDMEDEYLQEYNEKFVEMVVMPDGELVYTWDDRFRQRKPGEMPSTVVPEELERRNVYHKDRFATFEEFVLEWNGSHQRDPEKGRYGYWENPNGQYDYWRIGGRWRGRLPVKPGTMAGLGHIPWEFLDDDEYVDKENHVDYAYFRDIDFKLVEQETDDCINNWWERYSSGPNCDGFENWDIHEFLVDAGLRETPCVNNDELTEWRKNGSNGQAPVAIWKDKHFTLHDLMTTYRWYWDRI